MGTGTSGGRRSPSVCHKNMKLQLHWIERVRRRATGERRMNAGRKIFRVVVGGVTTDRSCRAARLRCGRERAQRANKCHRASRSAAGAQRRRAVSVLASVVLAAVALLAGLGGGSVLG